MNFLKQFVAGLGQQNAPFGFAPNDPNAAYRAGLGYIGDIGANLMANNQSGVDPWANLGASMLQAKQSSTERNRQQYTAQQLMEEAAARKAEREQAAQQQQWMEEQIAQLPPDQQALARMMPDKFFGARIEQQYAKPAAVPAAIQEYEYAKRQGFKGSLMDWETAKGNGTTVNINNGGIPDGKLRDSLDKAEGDLWAEYKKAGAVSGANAQDFSVLDELLKVAPQGPLTGRLAAMFPGVSSAADAVQSIVKRVAPTLRAPGSGSTSDIEYQGMLQSLPSLANQPEANAMILSIMKAKADLNVQRAEIITQYQTGEIDAPTARKKIAQLDKVSIMTPQMKKALFGISGESGGRSDLDLPAPEGWDAQDWQYLSIEEKQRVLGQ